MATKEAIKLPMNGDKTMFELIITSEQNKKAEGFVTIWENEEGVTRVSLEDSNPSDTDSEYVGKASPLVNFGALHFGGLANNGQWPTIKITFDESGAFRRAEAI